MTDTAGPPVAGEVGLPILRLDNITKRFGAVSVLRGVNLSLGRGEVLGLVGDNGAGKTTLVKIITGFIRADGGRIFLDGKERRFTSVDEARSHGIETVYQDLALIPQLSVYHNLFLNRELTTGGFLGLLSNRRMRSLARQYLDDINVNIPDIDAEAEMLSGGQRQAIAVARASRMPGVKVLLLDEPLAAMGAREASLIIDLIRDMSKSRGISMIVVDHNYTHLFEFCDRISVIQQGAITWDRKTAETSIDELTEFMVWEYRRQVMSGRVEKVE
jgi:ABC-type sugar transport system ATPase subunit